MALKYQPACLWLPRSYQGNDKFQINQLRVSKNVDDFGKSTNSQEETKKLIDDKTKVLQKIKMEVKGWTVSGEEPLNNLSESWSICQKAGQNLIKQHQGSKKQEKCKTS